MKNDFSSIDTLVLKLAQDIAIRLKARTVSYDVKSGTYSYYCKNEIIHRFTKKELKKAIKLQINKKIK